MKENGHPKNLELVKTIILNGQIESCMTNDENYSTIGIVVKQKVRRLNGCTEETVVDSFPFSKRMAEECEWLDKYVNIQMLTGTEPIDLDHIDETKIVSMMGESDSRYYHCYSELSGYLWTEETFKCGGHDLLKILHSHEGEYIHMEIELFRRKRDKK